MMQNSLKYGIIPFTLLCAGSLFLNYPAFVDAQTAPKWYCMLFCGLVLVLLWVFIPSQQKEYEKATVAFCLIISVLCLLQALYGICQYVGWLVGFSEFRVTGSFDNPAGFAASLCAGFPFLFYFLNRGVNRQFWVSIITVSIVCLAVVASESRAGMLSLLLVSLLVLYKLRVKLKYQILLLLSVCSLALAGLYVLKKDSADGRLLIWRCTYEMVKDKPQGFGEGGFKANYMNYQAKYFEEHPDSKYAMLADNVNRPFNEYLLLLVDYGICGLLLLTAFAFVLWRHYHANKQKTVTQHIAGWCLCGIAVFALFSYPLHYPFVWVMGIVSVVIILHRKNSNKSTSKPVYWVKWAIILPIAFLLSWGISQRMMAEMKWCRIAHKSLRGQTEQMLPEYQLLYGKLKTNELFLYNYAAELNVVKQYDKSLAIAHEYERLWADYDLQMLMADNYQNLKQYEAAEQHYRKAAAMCPVKFMPLYRLTELYNETGRKPEAVALAQQIVEKTVKIPSQTVAAIKRKMRQLIEKTEAELIDVPDAESRTSEQPPTTRPGSGGFSDAPYATRPP